jgi:FdhE protein
MFSSYENPHLIDKMITQAMENFPHSREILSALKPAIMARIRIVGSLKLKDIDYRKIDQERLKGGIPIIKQTDLLTEDIPVHDIALAVIPGLKQGLQALAEELSLIEKQIIESNIDLHDYLRAYPEKAAKIVDEWASRFSVKPSTINILCATVVRIFLEKRATEIINHLQDIVWHKGYCPICGAFPSLSLIQEKGGQRWLHCSQCGHEWKFSRVICPYCEHEGQEGMTFFFVEDRNQESAIICDKCNKYLVTLNKVGDLDDRDFEVSAISLIHLDMIMQDKGYLPMTECAWNIFAT